MTISRGVRVAALILLGSLVLYLVLPLLATLLFALATRWTTTILPERLTATWIWQTIRESRFAETIRRSLTLGGVVILVDLVLVVPALVVMAVTRSRWRPLLDAASLVPYAMPGVVLALALIRFYGMVFPALLNTPWLLGAAHAALALPIVYWAILNNLKAINLYDLYEAALTCGARWPQILRFVVLPNIRTGMAIAAVAGFTASFTDFAVANFVVGGSWLTFSVWQGYVMHQNGHIMAVTSVVSLVVTMVTTFLLIRLARETGPAPRTARGG